MAIEMRDTELRLVRERDGLVRDAADPRRQNRFWLGADLVVEVVSSDAPERDTVEKGVDYVEAGVPEYWIVDPAAEMITVLVLQGEAYATHGVFGRGGLRAARWLRRRCERRARRLLSRRLT